MIFVLYRSTSISIKYRFFIPRKCLDVFVLFYLYISNSVLSNKALCLLQIAYLPWKVWTLWSQVIIVTMFIHSDVQHLASTISNEEIFVLIRKKGFLKGRFRIYRNIEQHDSLYYMHSDIFNEIKSPTTQ